MIEVTTTTIQNIKIPSSFEGFRIVQVTDLHDAVFGEEQKDLFAEIRAAKPDLIVLTGDFVGSRKSNLRRMIRFLEKLPPLAPSFYVTGNHEYRLDPDDLEWFLSRMEEVGIHVLHNRTELIRKGEEYIQIVGVDDPAKVGEGHSEVDAEVLSGELRDAAFDRDLFSLLLVHRPEQISVYAEEGADVVLCGHSHGGQLRLPFIGAFYVPSQGWFPKYDCGLFKEGDTQMYISRGLGCSVVQMRLNCPPELSVIVLSRNL